MKFIALVLLLWTAAVLSAEQCCPNGEIISSFGSCGSSTKRINISCQHGHILLEHVILKGDKISTMDSPGFIFAEDPKLYCLGQKYKDNRTTETIPVAVVCFQEDYTASVEVYGVLTLVSVFFLIATLAVYMYLPQMRDLQGLCYMCLCISMALGFFSLGILQLSPGFKMAICATLGFMIYFWMLATFFWMNVICINLFRSITKHSNHRTSFKKQFLIYSAYAWGSTITLLIIGLTLNFIEGDHYKPGIGNGSCWFTGRLETWLFFYGPIALIISSNIVLFGYSSFKLWRDTRNLQENKFENLKHRFRLSLKLFLVMGISWVFEIASFAHGESHIIWTIMDTLNCLQGVIMFLLLVVLRRRAIRGLAEENCCLFVTKPLAEKLSVHDDSDNQHILEDEHVEVRLN